ncbi:hypothetical protein C8F04DRAFT_1197358 [Mycena alexandri]|uniref:Uncharacterized protein n=1 Tax=Mycena alexandri TaxID=1745969 RepID=A0AAD6S2R3_9AGAR|nr:hypothetical protein C8F04DRAFT_1197358 [Mycena alexandri]
MSPISESALPIVESAFPLPGTIMNFKFMAAFIVPALVAGILYYASPMRLTDVLIAAIYDVEKTYFDALDGRNSRLSASDVQTADMVNSVYSLRLKVSVIRETTLRNSLSRRVAFREFLRGRTFALLECIEEVRTLQIQIEILKEAQLREDMCHFTAFFRRRRHYSEYMLNQCIS